MFPFLTYFPMVCSVSYSKNPSSDEPFLVTPPSSQKTSKPSTAVRTLRCCWKIFPVKFSGNHLNSRRQLHHQVCCPLIYSVEGTPTPTSSPRTSMHCFFLQRQPPRTVKLRRVGSSPTTGFHLRCCRPPTSPFN